MKRVPLYSRSSRHALPSDRVDATAAASAPVGAAAPGAPAGPAIAAAAAAPTTRRARFHAGLARRERWLWLAGALLLAVVVWQASRPADGGPPLTFEQIDAAMRQSMEEKPVASKATRAYGAVIPSVVRVVGLMTEGDDGGDSQPRDKVERGVGSGVVIVDNGTILTNLHVVSGARRIKVTFADGLESDASVIGTQPENDLAVLRAKTIPDDLHAATMRSTGDLRSGDEVIAVGFPFGIGPSVSSGVVSGMKRQFRSPDGQQMLSNLIQFDAAANPGNSGGPLVTMDGEVVGIVTAILNPSQQRVFIGIGFAVPIENAAAAAGMPPF